MIFDGVLIGVISFLIIGAFHPIVIKCEYYFTEKIWPVFLAVGVLSLLVSCFIRQLVVSSALAIFGCACLWSIIELKEQTKRVEKGWFPQNPARTKTQQTDHEEVQ
ncbi:MAG: DUF4491 family protein [Lachnospiraceae bacterium]